MKVKCEYCGNYLSDTDEKCPGCMAPNEHLRRVANEVPQTIEELKNWYVEHNLPPEDVTRFFIGKDIREARAFGIYYDEKSCNYIVYKNKGSGERAVRYEGKDEAYAVNELYLKLKEEILHQKELNHVGGTHNTNTISEYRRRSNRFSILAFSVCLFMFISLLLPILFIVKHSGDYKSAGYYVYQEQPYYLYAACDKNYPDKCEWYLYNTETSEWSPAEEQVDFKEARYVGYSWDGSLGIDIAKNLQDEDWFKEIHPPTPTSGYYKYNDKTYYYFNGWYIYEYGRWRSSSVPSHEVEINPDNYYDTISSNSDTYDFKDTSYYEDYYSSSSYDDDSSWSSSSDDSWDSSSSWDSSDSWDSGSSDWDSDW